MAKHESDSLYLNFGKNLKLPIFGRGVGGVLSEVEKYLKNKANQTRSYWIATVNPEFVVQAKKNESFEKLLNSTDMNTIDGIGLVWAIKVAQLVRLSDNQMVNVFRRLVCGFDVGVEILHGKHRESMAAGSDLVLEMAKVAASRGWKMMLLGGFDDRAMRAAEKLKLVAEGQSGALTKKNKLNIEACEGEPKFSNEEVLRKINKFGPDILLVAYGMRKQEEWIDRNIAKLPNCVVMGVGRTFDYLSGDLKRASGLWKSKGLEWLYSLIMEPKRWRRQLALPRFIFRVIFG